MIREIVLFSAALAASAWTLGTHFTCATTKREERLSQSTAQDAEGQVLSLPKPCGQTTPPQGQTTPKELLLDRAALLDKRGRKGGQQKKAQVFRLKAVGSRR